MLRANTTMFQDPDASGAVTMLNPDGVNALPKIAPTSGRDSQAAFAPIKTGAPPAAGYAQTWTASTPVPDGAAVSTAHPLTVNPDVTVALRRGVSTNIEVTRQDVHGDALRLQRAGYRAVRRHDEAPRTRREAVHGHLVSGVQEGAPECRGYITSCKPVGGSTERYLGAASRSDRLYGHTVDSGAGPGPVDGPASHHEGLAHGRSRFRHVEGHQRIRSQSKPSRLRYERA